MAKETTIKCTCCGKDKSIISFYVQADKRNYNKKCKECVSEYHKSIYVKKPLKTRECVGCGEQKICRTEFNDSRSKHCSICISEKIHLQKKKVHKDDIELIVCNKCGKEMYKTKFILRKKNQRRKTCRSCQMTPEKKIKKKVYLNTPEARLRKKLNRIKYRALKKSVADGTVTAKFIRHLEELTKKCPMCNKKLDIYHIDHVIPLAKGGYHTSSNIQLLCPPCNIEKSDKILTLV